MPSPIKRCHCVHCRRAGARRSTVRRTWRSFRQRTRAALRAGTEPPDAISAGRPG